MFFVFKEGVFFFIRSLLNKQRGGGAFQGLLWISALKERDSPPFCGFLTKNQKEGGTNEMSR